MKLFIRKFSGEVKVLIYCWGIVIYSFLFIVLFSKCMFLNIKFYFWYLEFNNKENKNIRFWRVFFMEKYKWCKISELNTKYDG